jgi:pimeloyl-ACP methyl ester carboxylesterase
MRLLFRSVLTGMLLTLAAQVYGAAVTNDVAFTAAYDGSAQRYVVILPDGFNPAQSNDVLVCLHGHGSDRWQYVNTVRGETSAARDVARQYGMIFVSPDYRATTSWMGPAAEADMLQIIGLLKTQYKVKRMIFSGGSMGASSALTFTALHPELVDGVVALNGLANHETYTNFQTYIAASFGGAKPEVPDEYYKRSAVFFPERFTMPLAVTAGGQDTTVPPESVMQLAQAAQLNNPRVLIDYQASRGHETDYAASLAAYLFVVSTGAVTTVTNPAVVAYWNFNSGSNGVTDVSGNGHTLANSGVVISNGIAVFSGSQTNFSTASPLNLSACTNVTVEFFMRTASTNGLMMLLEHSASIGTNPGGFFIDLNENKAGQLYGSFKTTASWNVDQTAANAAGDGQWHHVAWVYDTTLTGADRTVLYFDRIAQGTYLSFTNSDAPLLLNGTLYIGSRANSTFRYVGELDDLRISAAALTASQFLQARDGETPPVIAYWRFDRSAPLADSSGNRNMLTQSGVTFTNGAAILNGKQATFNTLGTLNLTTCSNLTVEFFMRTTASKKMMALEQTSLYFTYPGAFMADVNETGVGAGDVMGGFCTASGTKLNLDITPTNAAADGRWHHVALVYDRTQSGVNRSRLYFDGVSQGTYSTWADGSDSLFQNATLYIGSRANTTYTFTGELDDIKFTGAALTPLEFMKKRTYYGGTALTVR